LVQTQGEISLYKGGLKTQTIIDSVAKIKKAFPLLPLSFYDVFMDRIKANKFCDERLIDAVNFVIDNCIYPAPTIAQFISFDKRMKTFTYEQMLKMKEELGEGIWDNYKAVRLVGMVKHVWIHVNDIEKYGIID